MIFARYFFDLSKNHNKFHSFEYTPLYRDKKAIIEHSYGYAIEFYSVNMLYRPKPTLFQTLKQKLQNLFKSSTG